MTAAKVLKSREDSGKKPAWSIPKDRPPQKKVGPKKGLKEGKVMVDIPTKKPVSPGSTIENNQTILLGIRQKLLSGIPKNHAPETLTTRTDTGDVADQAGHERDRELSLLFSGRDKEKLFAIDQALEKLREGTYGVCEECGEKIGPRRIKAMPLARFCVSCQATLEKEMSAQKKSEEDLDYGELPDSGAEEES